MDYKNLKELIYKTAVDFSHRGPGWSQERPLLWDVGQKASSGSNIQTQQLILTCWHDLFQEGKLSWGYDLDNPNAPFFHIPPVVAERDPRI